MSIEEVINAYNSIVNYEYTNYFIYFCFILSILILPAFITEIKLKKKYPDWDRKQLDNAINKKYAHVIVLAFLGIIFFGWTFMNHSVDLKENKMTWKSDYLWNIEDEYIIKEKLVVNEYINNEILYQDGNKLKIFNGNIDDYLIEENEHKDYLIIWKLKEDINDKYKKNDIIKAELYKQKK